MLSLIEKILFIIAGCIAVYFTAREFIKKGKLIKTGQNVNRLDKPGPRLLTALKRVLLQFCVYPRRPVVGFFHSMIFWGFLVFTLITINHIMEGFFENFTLLGHGLIYDISILLANFFALTIIVAVAFFLIRRYIFKPSSLDIPSWESLIILTFIFTLMLSFLLYEALRGSTTITGANFGALWISNTILPATISPPVNLLWTKLLWWLHILVIMAFAVYIPLSKHLHLIAGPINIFLKNNSVKAEIPVLNLEEQEKFGAPHINDLTQKDLLDLFSCAECGRCDDVCPAFNSGKDLSPKTLLSDLKHHLLESTDILMTKEQGELSILLENVISNNVVWDCTTCGACMEVCPMFNEHIPKLNSIRQYAVLMESKFPEELLNLYKGLENQGNPWGINAQNRTEWCKDLNIPLISEKGSTDVLIWIGCEGSYDDHNQKNTRKFIELLKSAKVDFAILGNEEKCCGDPARRSGHEYLFQILAQENIDTLNKYKFKKIIALCPHGYHVLKNEYSKMGGNYQVVHYSEFILQLVEEKKLSLRTDSALRMVYHDPCYLGRYNNIYHPARQLLNILNKNSLREMDANKEISFCCGAGGGGMWKEESKGDRINHVRIKQALETGADTIITCCPYCSTMFKDGIEETESKNLVTLDLAEVILNNLEGKE